MCFVLSAVLPRPLGSHQQVYTPTWVGGTPILAGVAKLIGSLTRTFEAEGRDLACELRVYAAEPALEQDSA